MCTILDYKNDEDFYETLLGFLTHMKPTTKELPKWNTCGFLTQTSNEKLTKFPSMEVFQIPILSLLPILISKCQIF